MELNEQEKERIVAEERVRMEARHEVMRAHWGGPGGGGAACCGYGHHRGFGLLRLLLAGAVIFALFHLWHRPHACGPYAYGAPMTQAPAPSPAPAAK